MAEIIRYDYDRKQLSEAENLVLDSLIKAGEVIHTIWQQQVDQENGVIKVLPFDSTKEELLEAAKEDPAILDNYTVVKRDGDRFSTTPYQVAYKTELEEFYQYMEEAANNTEEEPLREFINTTIEAFKQGDFQRALIAYVENPNTKIEFLVGPIETYEDQILGRKKTFQFNLRVLKEDYTDEVSQMYDVMRNIKLPQLETSVGANIQPSSIRVRIDDVIMFSGRQSTSFVSSTNLPNESDLVAEYGTKVAIYTTSMSAKFDKRQIPLLPYFTDLNLEKKSQEMRKAMFRWIALHEIAEGTVKFKGMEERMGAHYAFMRELNAHLAGMDSAKYQLMNGIITLEDYQNLLLAFLIYGIDVANHYEATGALADYAKGFAIVFNFLTENSSVTFAGGDVSTDFAKLARDVEMLSSIVLTILEEGTESDVDKLWSEYGDFSIFDQLPKPEIL